MVSGIVTITTSGLVTLAIAIFGITLRLIVPGLVVSSVALVWESLVVRLILAMTVVVIEIVLILMGTLLLLRLVVLVWFVVKIAPIIIVVVLRVILVSILVLVVLWAILAPVLIRAGIVLMVPIIISLKLVSVSSISFIRVSRVTSLMRLDSLT